MILFVAAMLAGLVMLAVASDQFVAGCSRLATSFAVPALLVGVVVIGFGTSLPELLVSVVAASQGLTDIAMGNVVGSTVANLTLVVGAAALIAPLVVKHSTLRREAPISMAGIILLAILLQGGVSRVEGVVLVIAMAVALTVILLRMGVSAPEEPGDAVTEPDTGRGRLIEGGRTLVGLVGTLAGAQLLVWGATSVADELELNEGFVGLTLVALGTSLPELFTAIQAARRRAVDLILGNVLGSNLFNVLAIAGIAALIDPAVLDERITHLAAAAMVVSGAAVYLMMRTGPRIIRWEGAILLIGYAALLPFLA